MNGVKLPIIEGWTLVKRQKRPHGAQWWQYEAGDCVVLATVCPDCIVLDPGWWHPQLDDGSQYCCYSDWEVAEDLASIRAQLRLGVNVGKTKTKTP